MRPRFKTTMICSSNDYELTFKMYKKHYYNKWDVLYEQLNNCSPYYIILGNKIHLKSIVQRNIAIRKGFIIHYE